MTTLGLVVLSTVLALALAMVWAMRTIPVAMLRFMLGGWPW